MSSSDSHKLTGIFLNFLGYTVSVPARWAHTNKGVHICIITYLWLSLRHVSECYIINKHSTRKVCKCALFLSPLQNKSVVKWTSFVVFLCLVIKIYCFSFDAHYVYFSVYVCIFSFEAFAATLWKSNSLLCLPCARPSNTNQKTIKHSRKIAVTIGVTSPNAEIKKKKNSVLAKVPKAHFRYYYYDYNYRNSCS